ncbi:hypothetical protein [Verminephrobacter eiseniae]|uniref:hypothetical protein n=1 Tax=Verminephrobacter eiseniae TaxID=364317 RepID=UPI002237CCFF|nr:hypothetical protein [Verminephrobacter eiseniae]
MPILKETPKIQNTPPRLWYLFLLEWSSVHHPRATTLAMSDDDYAINIPMVPVAYRDTWGLIDAIIDRYGAVDAPALSRMIHLEILRGLRAAATTAAR